MKGIIICFLLLTSLPAAGQSNIVDSLFRELVKAGSDTRKITLYNQIARGYQGLNLEEASRFADSALQLANAIDYQEGVANAYRNFGDINSDLGNYQEARDYYRLSLRVSREIDNPSLIIRSLNGLGISHAKLGEYEVALDHYQEGLRISEETGDKEMSAGIINNLGMIFFELENYPKAIESFENALKVNEELGEKKKVALILCNLANVQAETGQNQVAITNYRKSLEMAKEMGHKMLHGTLLTNIGLLQFKEGDLKNATTSYMEAMEIARDMEDRVGIAIVLTNLGDIDHEKQNYRQAIDKYLQSLEIALDIKAKEHESAAYKGLAQSYAASQNYKEAYRYLQLWKTLEDSLSSQENKQQIAALYTKYQTEKKEKENQLLREKQLVDQAIIERQHMIGITIGIVLLLMAVIAFVFYKAYHQKRKANFMLRQKNNEIEEKNSKLIQLNEEITRQNKNNLEQKIELEQLNYVKDKLLSIISHDFKSPLSTLQGTLYLLSAKVLTNEDVHRISRDLAGKVDHAASLLDNLLNWAKSQLQGMKVDTETINLSTLTQENIALLQPMAEKKGVVLENQISSSLEACADKNMIRLVIRNLMSNAIKFSDKGDTVVVTGHKNEDYVEVKVKDTGAGIRKEDKDKVLNLETYSTQGTASEKGTGLGLILCQDFIRKNGGDISFTSTEGEGSTFKFSLPVDPVPDLKKSRSPV